MDTLTSSGTVSLQDLAANSESSSSSKMLLKHAAEGCDEGITRPSESSSGGIRKRSSRSSSLGSFPSEYWAQKESQIAERLNAAMHGVSDKVHDVTDKVNAKMHEMHDKVHAMYEKGHDWIVCHFHHLPQWLQDNEYLHWGHRPPLSSFKGNLISCVPHQASLPMNCSPSSISSRLNRRATSILDICLLRETYKN